MANANIYDESRSRRDLRGSVSHCGSHTILARLLEFGGPDRIMFGTGSVLTHPQPIVDALARFEMPEELLRVGAPEITRRH